MFRRAIYFASSLANREFGPTLCARQRRGTKRQLWPSIEALERRVTPSVVLTGLAAIRNVDVDYTPGPVVDSHGNVFGTYAVYDNPNGVTGVFYEIPAGTEAVKKLYEFSKAHKDGSPESQLVIDRTGTMYGATPDGGDGYGGTVFSISPSGGYRRIASFANAATGLNPVGDITLVGGVIYGTTEFGGTNSEGLLDNTGAVFSVPAAGGTPQLLAKFDGAHGSGRTGGLTYSNGFLYGTTAFSGGTDTGTLFSIPAGGNTITTLATFPSGIFGLPHVLVEGGYIYGATRPSGFLDGGQIYRMKATAGNLALISFLNLDTFGHAPSDMINDHGKIIGVTLFGGRLGSGTVFEVDPRSFTIGTLAAFHHTGPEGTAPFGISVDDAGNVYGASYGRFGLQPPEELHVWKLSGLSELEFTKEPNANVEGQPLSTVKVEVMNPPPTTRR
jgi:uncharacterized repeat protein (TIGR03803 family)